MAKGNWTPEAAKAIAGTIAAALKSAAEDDKEGVRLAVAPAAFESICVKVTSVPPPFPSP